MCPTDDQLCYRPHYWMNASLARAHRQPAEIFILVQNLQHELTKDKRRTNQNLHEWHR